MRDLDPNLEAFLAALGHELRNFLGGVSAAADILLRAPDRRDMIEGAGNALKKQSRQLAGVVDGLQRMSRIRRGRMTLSRDVVDLRELVDEALGFVEVDGVPLGDRVERRLGDQPLWIRGDRGLLAQIVADLARDAVATTADARTIEVSASIDGEHTLLRLGTPAARADGPPAAASVDELGCGRLPGEVILRSTITRGLVELQGGTLALDRSPDGRGVRIALRLPLAPAPANEHGPRRVVVVAGDPDLGAMLRDALTQRGRRVTVVRTGQAAVDALRTDGMALLLCESRYADTSAADLARTIRDDEALARIPVLSLAGDDDAHEVGIEPVTIDGLDALLGRLSAN